jgi:hypothetical protein
MKQLCAFALAGVALIGPSSAAAQAVPRSEVYTALVAIQDPTTPIPESFKPIEKDLRAYRVARLQYDDLIKQSLDALIDVGGRSLKTNADLTAFAKECDSHSKQIAYLATNKQQLVAHMRSTPQGKQLWQYVTEVKPEYNDALTATYDARYKDAVLKLLANTRDAYLALAANATPFTQANGMLMLNTEDQSYIYAASLANLRGSLRDIALMQKERYTSLLNQPGIYSTYGNEYIADLTNKRDEQQALLDTWARTTPVSEEVYTPLRFFVRVHRAIRESDDVQKAKQRLQQVRKDQQWSSVLTQADVANVPASLRAIAHAQNVLTAVREYEKAVADLTARMSKEILESYNINRAIVQASDTEFTAPTDAAIATAYAHGLVVYQTQLMTQLQVCLGAKGKQKCTAKVKDDITVTVTDKKIQKTLDTLKQTFLKTYQPTYDRYKGKDLPVLGE